ADASPVRPTGLPAPQPATPGSPTPDAGANPVAVVPKPDGRYGATRQANDGGISTPNAAVTVTVSPFGCEAVGEATSRALACPNRKVVFCAGIWPVDVWQGVLGEIRGATSGEVVTSMFPGTFVRHGRMEVVAGSDVFHVIV